MDESRKRVLGIKDLNSCSAETGSVRCGEASTSEDVRISDAVRWAEEILKEIDSRWSVK
jgi:hypothetical protein